MKNTFASYGYTKPTVDNGRSSIVMLYILTSATIFILLFYLSIYLEADGLFIIAFFYLMVSIIGYNKVKNLSKEIIVGSKFLIEGNSVIYFKNLSEITVNYRLGIFSLLSSTKKLDIHRRHFPTESSKTHKIKISQKKKFKTISAKIHKKIIAAYPTLKVSIINEF